MKYFILGLVVLVFMVYLAKLRMSSPTVHYFAGDGPRILLIAGTHGDEPGPSYALEELINENAFAGRNVTCIPNLNPFGRTLNLRFNQDMKDINRGYNPGSWGTPQNKLVGALAAHHDIIFDLHEANDFHLKSSWSLGNTLVPADDPISNAVAATVVRELNKTIENKLEKYSSLNKPACRLPGALSCFIHKLRIPYILVEVCRGSRVLPPLQTMETRKQHTRLIVATLLSIS